MVCEYFRTEDGRVSAIVCSRKHKPAKCAECGCTATRMCDWKLTGRKAGKTCDRLLCKGCAVEPVMPDGSSAEDKHLCPAHARIWEERKQVRSSSHAP